MFIKLRMKNDAEPAEDGIFFGVRTAYLIFQVCT